MPSLGRVVGVDDGCGDGVCSGTCPWGGVCSSYASSVFGGVLVFSGIVVFGVPPIFFCFVGGLASLTAGGWYRGVRGGLRSAFGARYGGLRGW